MMNKLICIICQVNKTNKVDTKKNINIKDNKNKKMFSFQIQSTTPYFASVIKENLA